MRSAPLHFICFLRLVVLDDVLFLIIFVIIAEVVVIQIIGPLGIGLLLSELEPVHSTACTQTGNQQQEKQRRGAAFFRLRVFRLRRNDGRFRFFLYRRGASCQGGL